MKAKLRPILVKIGNFLDRWGNWFLPVLAAIIGVLFTSADFFNFNHERKTAIYSFGVFLTIIFAICSATIEQKRPRINELEETIKEQQEIIDEIAKNIFIFFDGLSLNLAKRSSIENNSKCRVSIYLHFEKRNCFIRCGRYSDNPKLAKGGRPEYPEDEGCISKGWETGWYYVDNLPQRRDRHQKRCDEDYNIPKPTHDNFTMLSRSIAVKRLSYNGNKPIAVIVVESLEKTSFKEADLREILESVSDDYAETISVFHDQIIKSHTSKGVE